MDAKYLAEIKARAEGAAVHEYDGITDLVYGRDINALLADNAAKDQQIATLERALKLANITIQKLSGENYEYSTSSFQAQEQEGHDD